jgi:four helix bundle protein
MKAEAMKRTENQTQQFKTFEDLEVYQVAREFRKAMYRVAKRVPEEEKFALANQIRRAAVSLTNNIAEGHGRFHFLEQIKFLLQARGSLEELLDDLNVCEDELYLALTEIARLKQEGWRVHKLINGYVRFLRGRVASDPSRIQEGPSGYDSDEDDLANLLLHRFNPSTLQRFDE